MSHPKDYLAALRKEYSRRDSDTGLVERYSASSAANSRRIKDRDERIARIMRHLGKTLVGQRVLDIGCGFGDELDAITDVAGGGLVVGIDPIMDRLSRARANAKLVCARGEALPFADQQFDVALQYTVFSSLPDSAMIAVSAEVQRVVRPGGMLLWYDLRLSNPSNPAVHAVSSRRIRQLFPHHDVHLESATLLPPLARALTPRFPTLSGLLDRIPALHSHLIAVIVFRERSSTRPRSATTIRSS